VRPTTASRTLPAVAPSVKWSVSRRADTDPSSVASSFSRPRPRARPRSSNSRREPRWLRWPPRRG
jgi:hypothetical protein